MSLWDSVSNVLSGGGRDDVNEGYDRANRYMDPFRRGGEEDYNRMRAEATRMGGNLDKFGNAGDWMYGHINQSPNSYYDEIMHGYSESPEAKYEQEQAMRGASAGASASGMLGSGAFMKGIQQNAADISNRDRDRYYQNVMNAGNTQMGYLQNLQNQKAQQQQMLQYLTSLGYNAASGMGGNEINRGNANAVFDQGAFNDFAGMAGAGIRSYNRPPYMDKPPYMGR